jgi:arginase
MIMNQDQIRIGLTKLLHTGSRAGSEISEGPTIMEEAIKTRIEEIGCVVVDSAAAYLTPEEELRYGVWHRLGLVSHHLGDVVADMRRRGLLTIGFLANCNGLMGMLGGLQRSGQDWRPLRVGLVYCDAHGDFNTPETTLSGMLGGMPVAVSTGMCLTRLRIECGLDPALPSRYVTLVGVRDLDPLEQELVDRLDVGRISVDEVRRGSPSIDLEMERLAILTDLIYIHIDLDVLDPSEVPGHDLSVEDGPTSMEMADALRIMFEHPKAAAFGIASYPVGYDEDGLTLRAVSNLVEGVVSGLKKRDDLK